MSFTFRNLFSEEGGESAPESPEGANPRPESSNPPTEGFRGEAPAGTGEGGQGEPTHAFLVSELLPFIPPAIAAKSGIPMEEEILIPIPSDGGTDVKLSTVYQICPQLFAAEITPLNDTTLTLPTKIGGPMPDEETPDKLSGVAFGVNPFEAADSEADEESSADEDNPFWSPEPLGSSEPTPENKEPEKPSSESATPEMAGFAATADESPAKDSSEKEVSKAETASMSFTGFGDAVAAESSPANEGSFGSGFTSGASGFAMEAGGDADTSEVPANPFEEAASSSKAPEAGTEKAAEREESVEETGAKEEAAVPAFSGSPFEGAGGFATPFSDKAADDEAIPFPAAEENPATEEATDSQAGNWGTMFQSGFDSGAEGDTQQIPSGFGNMLAKEATADAKDEMPEEAHQPEKTEEAAEKPSGAAAAGFASPPASSKPADAEQSNPAMSFGFEEVTDQAKQKAAAPAEPASAPETMTADFGGFTASGFEAPSEAPPEKEQPKAEEVGQGGFANPIVNVPPAEEPVSGGFAAPEETAANSADMMPEAFSPPTEEKKVEAVQPSEPVVESPREKSPNVSVQVSGHTVNPVVEDSPATAVTPQESKPASSAPVAGAPFVGANAESDEDLVDLEMKAIFSTSESFNLSKVARKIVELSGMLGCAIATPSHLVQASKSEENRLGDEAQEMVNTVKNLAKLTGLPDAKSFTLQTDRGIVSLFMEGACCLIVRHDSANFGPGIREKLILISRNLYKLND